MNVAIVFELWSKHFEIHFPVLSYALLFSCFFFLQTFPFRVSALCKTNGVARSTASFETYNECGNCFSIVERYKLR